jgi:hypothetical protein
MNNFTKFLAYKKFFTTNLKVYTSKGISIKKLDKRIIEIKES